MEIRPPNRNDYEGAAQVVAAALGRPMDPAVLRDAVLFDEDFDPNLVLVAREKGVTLGFLAGVLKERGGEKKGFFKLLAVLPERQRRGLGRELVERMEERFRDEGGVEALAGPCPPLDFFPGVPEDLPAARAFFEGLGYRDFEGGSLAWAAAPSAGASGDFQAGAGDLAWAADLAREKAPEWSAALEEAFSHPRPGLARARGGGVEALCFYRAGEGLGPLLVRSGSEAQLQELIRAAALLASQPPPGPEGLRLRQPEPLALWAGALELKGLSPCRGFRKRLA